MKRARIRAPEQSLEPDAKRARLQSRGLIWSQTQKGPDFKEKGLSGARHAKSQTSRPRAYLEPDAKRARLQGQGLIWSQTRKGPDFKAKGLSGARHAKCQTSKPKAYLEPDAQRVRFQGRGLIWSRTRKGPGFRYEGQGAGVPPPSAPSQLSSAQLGSIHFSPRARAQKDPYIKINT